ncbi:hypothetical protein Pan258_19690 [Symmachiella dynata]|nr:hypothetical protein Pan258_19690 [Symmachiella dynata]
MVFSISIDPIPVGIIPHKYKKIPDSQRLPQCSHHHEDTEPHCRSQNPQVFSIPVVAPANAVEVISNADGKFIMGCFSREFVELCDWLALILESLQYSGNNHLPRAS